MALTALPQGLKLPRRRDAQHHPLDVGWILPQYIVAIEENVGLEVSLEMFGLAVALNTGIGRNPNDGTAAKNRAFEIGDLHRDPPQTRELRGS